MVKLGRTTTQFTLDIMRADRTKISIKSCAGGKKY